MSGPWGVWDDCPVDYGMDIDAAEFPTYRAAAREVRRWLAETGEYHLYPDDALRHQKSLCDGGPDQSCEGYCPDPDGEEPDHRVLHDVWSFRLVERKGMTCGDPRR